MGRLAALVGRWGILVGVALGGCVEAPALPDLGPFEGADDGPTADAEPEPDVARDAGAGPCAANDAGVAGERCTVGQGACAAEGTWVCVDGALRCDALAGDGTDEACNAIDDDCDGRADEDIAPGACDTALAGVCGVGIEACAGGAPVCEVDVEPGDRDEACNGLDDDCDGRVDEVPGTGEDCAIGVGACAAAGETVCDADSGLIVCSVSPGAPADEVCNGEDDDCDGETDEDEAVGVGEACDTALPGVCGDGLFECTAGVPRCRPVIAVGERAEVCDGIDDDCDGAVDEQVEPVDGIECDPGCDGIDDDGDGASDEGCAEVTCEGDAQVVPCNGCPDGTVVPAGWSCIPAGEFQMGSPIGEAGRTPYEGPRHRVWISRPFLVMRTEVTRGQWADVATAAETPFGARPSFDEGRGACDGDRCPVEQVSWLDGLWYANALSLRDGFEPCYDPELLGLALPDPGAGCPDGGGCMGQAVDPNIRATLSAVEASCPGYRLPTEAEWAYAARAGTQTAWWSGDDWGRAQEVDWVMDELMPVGTRPRLDAPLHPWGLFDVQGNVREWVQDGFGRYPARTPLGGLVDPIGSPLLDVWVQRVSRGGGGGRQSSRLAFRDSNTAETRSPTLGLRLARTVDVVGALAGARPVLGAVTIEPAEVTVDTPVTVTIEVADPDGDLAAGHLSHEDDGTELRLLALFDRVDDGRWQTVLDWNTLIAAFPNGSGRNTGSFYLYSHFIDDVGRDARGQVVVDYRCTNADHILVRGLCQLPPP